MLLAAGLAKAWDWAGGTSGVPGWAAPLVPAGELALGAWLVSGACRFGAWLAAVVLFAAFALVAFAQVTAGRSDCGCFGSAVAVPPVLTLGLDIAILLLLARRRPGWAGWPAAGPATGAVAVAGAVLAGLAGFAVVRYGSVPAGVAAAAGRSVFASAVDIGRAPAGSLVDAEVAVVNLSGGGAQVAHVSMPCRCAEFHGLPADLPAGQATTVRLTLRVPSEPGRFRKEAVVHTSAGEARFELAGWATAP